MKAYIIQTGSFKDRLVTMSPNGVVVVLATPTEPQYFTSYYAYEQYKKTCPEVEIKDIKWQLPHLYKPVRAALDNES